MAHLNLKKAKKEGLLNIIHQNDQHLGPTSDQDSIGYCYAYAASDMLEQHLKRKSLMPKQQNLSPMGIGLNNHKLDWQNKTGAYHALAIKRKALGPELEYARQTQRLLEEEIERNYQSEDKIFDSIVKKHPDYKRFRALEKMKQSDSLEVRKNIKEKLSKIRQSISRKVFKNKEYQRQVRERIKENSELDKKLKHYTNLEAELLASLQYNNKEIVPDGGTVKKAIQLSWSKLCFETEVNSRDSALADIYNQHRDLIYNNIYTNSLDFQSSLMLIELAKNSSWEEQCISKQLIYNLFPGLPLNSKELSKLISGLKVYENLLDKLIEKSCKKKKLPKKAPPVKVTEISEQLPLSENEHLFKAIDQELQDGGIASVAYRAQIFDKDYTDNSIQDYHASTIVGKASLCGENYYIVRNSWGKKACAEKAKSYTSSTYSNDVKPVYFCEAKLKNEMKTRKFKSSIDKEIFRSNEIKKCRDKSWKNNVKSSQHPYFCDGEGNFFIKKSQLKKGVYRVSTID